MLETIDRCPICNSQNIGHSIDSKDYSITGEPFTINQCLDCHFLFTNPRPDKNSIGKYYQSEKYISHSDKSNTVIDVLYKLVRNYTLGQKIKLINKLTKKGKILDYGCGTGYFLQACKKNGWEISGVEPDTTARQLATQNTATEITENLEPFNGKQFDLITLWHVLEHVHELKEVFAKLKHLLKQNGKLLIAVPNHLSYDATKYKEHWAAYDLPRHLYHFSPTNVETLANEYSMQLAQILPMKFDSYYVSMLSEKYLGNNINLLKPFLVGYKSNKLASKTRQYSSLIYILNNNTPT